MDNQIQNRRPSDEIDLFELFNRMGNGIKNFFNWILNLLKSFIFLLISKSVWIISFSIIGGIVAYLFFQNTSRFYSSEMVARSNSMNNSIIVNSINLLNSSLGNPSALVSYLGITQEQAKKIRSINAYYGIDINRDKIADIIDYDNTYNPKDTTLKRLPDIFYLKITVFDESIFPKVRDGIKNYIGNNPYILENNEVRKQQALSLIEEYKSEIRKLDSLQKIQYFEIPKVQKSGNGQIIVLNEKESKLYHNDKIALYDKQLKLEKELVLNPDPITVIQDFTLLSKAENPLIIFQKFWVFTFAIIGFFVAILWQYRVKIWKLIREKQY